MAAAVRVYFPWAACLIVSLVATVVLNLISRRR
ncbi:MAG TPA: DUF2905 family protein [Acidimicrobiales bacterium]|jgi:hypothetical protein|nr:DUF2905 family protein [Acidimicrobiales bacterium]